jgi:hypothetical protein
MALSVQAKTTWLVVIGALVIAIELIPFRLTPVVSQSIDTLTIPARAHLIERFEGPAKVMDGRADSLRQAITTRYGGTTPSQDSLLSELEDRAAEMLQVVAHLRDPRQATFEEKRQDVGRLLERLLGEASGLAKYLTETYLK